MGNKHILLAAVIMMAMVSSGTAHAELKVLDRPMWLFPGEQFRVCIEQPAGSGELKCDAPAMLEMFDTWDQDAIQRYYFKSIEPGLATLKFSGAGGELEMEIEVLAWADLYAPRSYKDISLPRLWPMDDLEYGEIKTQRTLYTDEDLAAMRKKGGVIARAKRWAETDDETIYNIIPGPSVPRTCLIVLGGLEGGGVGKGCPVCGTDIYEGRDGFYPWLYNHQENPWKVTCPNCGTEFPSNDWANGDMHSGPFPDDGYGCEPVKPVTDSNGRAWRWPFIAYYHEWAAYMLEFTPGIIESAQAYAATGDKVYAHKSAIALLRYAEAMADMSLNLNHRKLANRDGIYQWPVGAPLENRYSRLSNSFSYIQPNWDTSRMENAARAWDIIFDQLDDDEELIEFCQTHGHPEIESIEDFARFIETGVFRMPIQAALDNAVSRNYPQQEVMAATMAVALGTPKTLAIADELLNARGIRFALSNEYYKDGSAHESPGYNDIQIRDMARLFKTLERIKDLHPDGYVAPRFVSMLGDPKFALQYYFPLQFSLIGRTYPVVGDVGGAGKPTPIQEQQGFPVRQDGWIDAYNTTGDEIFLQAMYGPGGSGLASISDPELREKAQEAGERLGWQVQMPSNVLDGYGHAILRSGEGTDQRALWIRYSQMAQHAHPDMLTWGLEGQTRSLLPELGYPDGWTYAGHWETNWGTHYSTHITGLSSWAFAKGELTTFAPGKPVQVAAAESTAPLGNGVATRQRTVALVDISDTEYYAVTVERVEGGSEQTNSFHGPDGEATPIGITPEPYEGTALGEGTTYKDLAAAQKIDGELTCLTIMRDPARAYPEGVWGLDYLLRDQGNLHLRMWNVCATGDEVIITKAKPPAAREAYDMTWAITKAQADEDEGPLKRQYIHVVEPYAGDNPQIVKVEKLEVEGGDPEAQFEPLAIRLVGRDFTDTIIWQHKAGPELTVDGIVFDGEFGLWREHNGKFSTGTLVRGTKLLKGDIGVETPSATYEGEIVECDWANNSIVISPAPPAAPDLIGTHVRIQNSNGNDASYQIKSAKTVGENCQLTFAVDPRIGEGFVGGFRDGVVISDTAFRLKRYGYYQGKTIANETGDAWYPLKDVSGSNNDCYIVPSEGADLSATSLEKAFGDNDGDGLTRFVIYDFGPGDAVTIPNYVTVDRASDYTLTVNRGGGAAATTVSVGKD